MTVLLAVLSTANVNPEVFPVCCLKNELIKVGVTFQPVEPLAGGLHIGMALVVIPSGVRCNRQAEVSSFSESVLGGIGATNLDIELVAAVAGADHNGTTDETAEGFENFLA